MALCLGCASAAKPGTLYRKGADAFEADDMQGAVTALQAFVDKTCPPTSTDKRCREACVKLGHAHERLGSPAGAWAAYDAALAFGPHTRDAAVKADLERTQAQLAERRDRGGDQAPVVILYRDEVGDEFNARSLQVSVDFEPVVTKEKDANELHGADYRRIWGGSAPVGDHVVIVEAVHDCKPGMGKCARSHVRKAWSFKSAVHAPVTIQIRAYGEDGEGDAPAHPALDFGLRKSSDRAERSAALPRGAHRGRFGTLPGF
jgi:hypothetical protein